MKYICRELMNESADKRKHYYKMIFWNFQKTEEDIGVAAKAKTKEVSMEEALWKSADKLRGSVEPSEYKHVVLSLFFFEVCK